MPRASRTDMLLIAAAAFCGVALISAATVGAGGNGTGGSLASQRPALTWEEANGVLGPHAIAAPPEGALVPFAAPPRPSAPAGSASDGVAALRRAAGSGSGSDHSHTHSHRDGGHTAAGGPAHGDGAHGHGENGGGGDGHDGHGASHGHDGHGHDDHDHGSAWTGHHPRPVPGSDGMVDVPMFHQAERERTRVFWDVTGQISPWEINYEAPEYAEDDCGTDIGGIGVWELDPTKDCTMTHSPSFREGNPEEYFQGHGDHGPCRVEIERYDGAFDMAQRSRDVLSATYDNNPWQALADGYKPYPVAASKTFHMFSWDHWDARHDDGSPDLYNPERPAMFTYGMTDEGLMVVNIVYVFAGTEEEFPDGQQERWDEMLPRPYGCMVEWHGHNNEIEGPATGNLDGRDYMTHVWTWPRRGATWEYLGPDGQLRTYEGPYPFGEYGDGAEPHAWFRPYNYLPALCNKDGGCI